MAFLLIFSVVFFVWIFFDFKKKSSNKEAILSPFFYFACLWFVAFPLHAWLLYQGWVDTQQHVVLTKNDLTAAVWMSLASLLVTYYGMLTGRPFRPKQSTEPNAIGTSLVRISLVLVVLMALAALFLSQTVLQNGIFTPFIGNAQNEARIGSGPLFILSELFIYGLIVAISTLLASDQRKCLWWLLVLISAVGFVLAVYMGIVLTSRRVIVLPLFALALAWIYLYLKQSRAGVLVWLALLANAMLAVPALQSLRYIATPPTAIETNIDEYDIEGTDIEGVNIGKTNIADHCRWIERQPVPQKSVTILESNGNERTISGINARVATALCDAQNYNIYFFVQIMASSYGLIDHVATFLRKASPSELLFGVDHGIAWGYNMALALLPRTIWEEKPLHYGSVGIQKWLYPEMFKDRPVTVMLPPSYIVDFLYGFGFLSLIALSFGLGRLLAWVHVWLHRGFQPSPARFVISLFLMVYMFNIVRGGTSFVQTLIPMLAIMLAMYGRKAMRQLITTNKNQNSHR